MPLDGIFFNRPSAQLRKDATMPAPKPAAPLRNRLRVELNAPVAAVWALIGDLARFPEYSAGLARVEVTKDAGGAITDYVCHFKPHKPGAEGIVHREPMRWYEANRGYASGGEPNNAFGLFNDLNLVTIEPTQKGTLLTWEEYFDAADLVMNKASYDQALADIGENLVRRFGGRVVERYVEA